MEARPIIERQLDHLVRLIDELLEMSRLTLGKVRPVTQLLDVRALLDDAVFAYQAQLEAAEHRLSLERPDRSWSRRRCQPGAARDL